MPTKRQACYQVPKHHARLWKEHRESAQEVTERVEHQGDARVQGFSDGFLPELHHRLYAERPQEVPEGDRSRAAAMRGKLHELVSELPEFETLRKLTVRDPLWAGMACASLGEQVASAMPERPEDSPDPDQAQETLEGLLALQEELGDACDLDARIDGAMSNYVQAASDTCDQAAGTNEAVIRQALRRGIEQAHQDVQQAKEALAALGWGEGAGTSQQSRDPETALALARKVKSSHKLREILDVAGRLTLVARAKRAARNEYARSEVVGVEQTGHVERLLGSELALLDDPIMGDELLMRLGDKKALGYKMVGKEKEGKGPLILAIDDSYSMLGAKETWARAVALAMLDAAREENRPFGIIIYDERVHTSRIFPDPKLADPREILELLTTFNHGGTKYAPAITLALDWIESRVDPKAKKLAKADVVHITDGEADASGAREALARAERIGARIYGVAIGFAGSGLKAWSHEVTSINDVSRDGPAVDLIFDNV